MDRKKLIEKNTRPSLLSFGYDGVWHYFRKRFFKYLPPLSLFLLLSIIALIIGFIYFSEKVSHYAPPHPLEKADAIIVLTGGDLRVETGIALLKKGYGERLLISGVNKKTSPKTLIKITKSDPKLFECCIDIGYEAENTLGNARESATWVFNHGYQRVYIVTNDYHMPRALREFSRYLPNTQFIAYPIVDKKNIGGEMQEMNKLRLIISEYIKFIGAELRGWFL